MQLKVTTQTDVQIFRDWLRKQRHLPQDVEDHYIASFIIGAKGSVEKAKKVFDQFYKVQQTMPELFKDFDPMSDFAEKLNRIVCIVNLPKRTPEKYTVCMGKLIDTNPKDYSNVEMFVRFFVLIQILLWDDNLGNGECIFVIDATGVTLSHLRDINPVMAKKMVDCITLASPVRIKSIHLVNLPQTFEWAVGLFRQLMPDKLKKRLHLHPSYAGLRDEIPKNILPQEYGGDEISIYKLYDNYRERVRHYREKCKAQRLLRAQELQFRPKKSLGENELSGTFRSLAID